MVSTISEARSVIASQQAQVEAQRQAIQSRVQRSLSQAELRARTRGQLAQQQLQSRRIESQKQEALNLLKPIDVQLAEASKGVESVAQQQAQQQQRLADFETAKKLFRKGIVDPGVSQSVKKLIREFEAGREIATEKAIRDQLSDIEQTGLTPIFQDGVLVGVEDALRKQSRELEQLKPIVIDSQLVGFEDIAQRLSRQLKVSIPIEITTPPIPPGVVRAGEKNIEQLIRNIKESEPQFAFVKNKDIREALQKATPKSISQLGGLEKFSRSKFSQTLSSPTGVFKFTPEQAERISGLTNELVGGFILGAGLGKVFTLVKGAGARFLPSGLTGSPKFKQLTNILGGGATITLTAGAGLSLKRTFEEEGIDKAIQEAVGFVAFGVGFGKTGLKTTAQAEKEFKKVTDLLKKGFPDVEIPTGKTFVSVVPIFKKKKKIKGRFAELSELEEAQSQLSGVKRLIAEQRTPELQLQILKKLQRTLKTKTQKENFKKFVQDLLDQNILILPKVKVAPGITAKVVTGKPKPLSFSTLRNQKRVATNKARNQKRVDQAKKPLGQRFKEAQALLVVSGVKLTSAQRIKQEQKAKQKLGQKLIQKIRQEIKQRQRLRQRLKQKAILRQRVISKLKLRQLLGNTQKFGRGLRQLKKFGVPLPPKFPKKKVKKKKVVKIIPFEISGKSFNVFERRRGKLRQIAKNLPENLAKRTLAQRLDNRISASGRIVPSKQPPKKKDVGKFNFPSKKFRRPVPKSPLRKPNTFNIVERSRFRIDSKKEKETLRKARIRKIKSNASLEKTLKRIPALRKK